jgi:hypothetical protein
VVKHVVVVTLISGPHRVHNCASALRARDESTVLSAIEHLAQVVELAFGTANFEF